MIQLLILFQLTLFNISTHAQEMADHKGYVKLNSIIFDHVFLQTEEYNQIGFFLEEPGGLNFVANLSSLLGFYDQGINKGEMTNGKSNSISFLVHYLLFNEIAKKISSDCEIVQMPDVKKYYHEKFYDSLVQICLPSNGKFITKDEFFTFWLFFHSFDAPLEEFESWYLFHTEGQYKTQAELVSSLALTAMMNPYFFINN